MSLDGWYRWLLVASVIVVVGVILEGDELWREYREKGWRPIWPKVGFGLLVIGLAAEIFFQSEIESVDAALKRGSDIKVGTLEAEARSAGSRIATAQSEAANARLETAQLEKEVAGRHLTTKQIAAIGVKMKDFAGYNVYIGSYSGDAEAVRLGLQIKAALEHANIRVDNNLGRVLAARGGADFGVHVTGLDADKPFVNALIAALHDEGKIDVSPDVPAATFRIDSAVVGIMVALRPLS